MNDVAGEARTDSGTSAAMGSTAHQEETGYEELVSVGYHAEHGRLEATIIVKQPRGYGGGPGGAGSREYVRFFVDEGTGFTDVGLAAAQVHDAGAGTDCQGLPGPPLTAVVGVAYAPPRASCRTPRLPRLRAVLSWQVVPPAGDPEFTPRRGHRLDAHIQLPARRPRFSDYLAYLVEQQVALPEWHAQVADGELTAIEPAPLGLDEAIRRYGPSDVPPHRYALPHVVAALNSGTDAILRRTADQFAAAGLDWAGTVHELFNADGDTSYERITALGLDNNTDTLVATVQVRAGYGYLGGPCSAGSTEYVAFWADWTDECVLSYLGTAQLTVRDFAPLPDGGLSYAAVLPVDLSAVRRPGDRARPSRIRAVLSWGVPPSVTDPYAMPYWGDARDAHVQVRPGPAVAGPALSLLAGVRVSMVDAATGLIRPDAAVRGSGLPADPDERPRAFTGRIAVRGTGLADGQLYRLMVRNLDTNSSAVPVSTPFVDADHVGGPIRVHPSLDGWTQLAGCGPDVLLGEVETDGAQLWEIWLETTPPTPVVRHRLRFTEPAVYPAVEPIIEPAVEPGRVLAPTRGAVPERVARPVPTRRGAQPVAVRAHQSRGYFSSAHEFATVDRKPARVPAPTAVPAAAPAEPAGTNAVV